MVKLAGDNAKYRDLYFTQALVTVLFSTSLCTYYILSERDVVLPIDNLLTPRRKYMEEDHHRLITEQQQKLFTQVRRRTKMAQKNRTERVNKIKEVEFGVGDSMFYKFHLREGKLDQR